jgi:hypothetical protein
MDVGAEPSVELRPDVEQHLHQPHHPGVVNLDAGNSGFTGYDRQSHPLKQWKSTSTFRDCCPCARGLRRQYFPARTKLPEAFAKPNAPAATGNLGSFFN